MATPTYDDIKALDFGYLTGANLLQWCPAQFLIKQQIQDLDAIATGVAMAYQEVIADLSSRYDINSEFAKTGSSRFMVVVKITSVMAIRNILGNSSGMPEVVIKHFDWLDVTIKAIRNGQLSLPSVKIPDPATQAAPSDIILTPSSFNTLS